VTFNRNGSPVCSNVAINASGQATCTITFTLAGNYNITAVYSGDTNFNASTSTTLVQQVLGPTAAPAMVSGRVLTADGRGIARAMIMMHDSMGVQRTAITNQFGYYRFIGVASGEAYLFTVSAKNRTFDPPTVVVTVNDNVTGLDFTSTP
jgi:hypothetical protein